MAGRRPRPGRRRDRGLDTPTGPLPAPADQASGEAPGASARRPVPPGGLRAAAGAGLRHARRSLRPLLAVVLVQVLFAATVVVPFQAAFAARLDHHAHAPALAGRPDAHDDDLGWAAGLDPGVWADARRLEASLLDGLSLTLFWVVVGAWLFGAVAAGGFLGTALRPEARCGAGRFFAEGGRWFGRMLRVGLVFLVVAWALGRLVLEAWANAAGPAESAAASEGVAWWGARLREAVYVAVFLWLRVAADLARADLVHFARRSAVLAFLRGIGRTLRHPVRTMGLALTVGVPAFAFLLLLGLPLRALGGDRWWTLLLAFLVVQVAVLVRWASRAAMLGGCVRLVGSGTRA